MRPSWLLPMLFLLPSSLAAQPVLLESALVLHAPGYRGIWPAWYDGDRFWVQTQPLMELLGYEILVADSTELTVRDERQALRFAYDRDRIEVNGEVRHTGTFSMIGPDGQPMITMSALQQAFGADLEWDASGLILRLSSAASLFDATKYGERPPLDMEPPQNILFPRERTWLGGLHVGYVLRHEWHASTGRTFTPSGRVAAHLAGGTVTWDVAPQISRVQYTWDFTSAWLTQLSVGQVGSGLGVQLSNRPLHPRRVHREAVRRGKTFPHAIARSIVSGAVSEQVQADGDGRYMLRSPVFYGSTETIIEVQPLGSDPMVLSETHSLTPSALLPGGQIEYNISAGASPSGAVAWGMTPRLTLSASASSRTATVGLLALPLQTLTLDTEVDLRKRSVRGDLQWWRPWGGLEGTVHVRPGEQMVTADARWSGGDGTVAVRLTHHRTASQPPLTTVQSVLGWQFLRSLRVDTGIQAQPGGAARFGPRLTYALPLSRPRVHLRASAVTTGRELETWQGGTTVTGRAWSGGVQVRRSVRTGELEAHASLQVNTDWAWFDARGGWRAGDFFHAQALRGTVMLGKDIRFAALYEERTQAVLRLFIDRNLNGVLDEGETLSLGHQVRVGHQAIAHEAKGDVVVPNVLVHEPTLVEILPESIRDPLLHPATGYRFHFVGTPGRTRYIDIPLQPLPTVVGRLTGWSGSYTILQVHLQGMTQGIEALPVYQDGGFVTRLPAGTYQATITNLLTGETVTETTLTVTVGENYPVISLSPE